MSVYTKPCLDLWYVNKYWTFLTKNMQPAEVADFEVARSQLEHYEKIYTVVEYASDLNNHMTILQRRMNTNNPTIPQNLWRQCSGN